MTAGADSVVAPDDAGAQMEDVVRTRVYLSDADDVLAVSKAHGRIFSEIKPVNTLLEISKLIGNYRVEIEAEAVLR